MQMQTFVAWVRHAQTGAVFRVMVQADNMLAARMMVEAQYGADNLVHPPMPE